MKLNNTLPSPVSKATCAKGHAKDDTIAITARDVTGSAVATGRFQRSSPVASIAKALANRMQLPTDVSWTLREAHRGQFLDENQPLGEQLGESADVDVVPKVHLG